MTVSSPLCPVCGKPAGRAFRPCPDCRDAMEKVLGHPCGICGRDLAGGTGPCTSCRGFSDSRALIRSDALGDWNGPLREWLSMYKYGGDVRLGDYLAERLAAAIECRWPGLPVVPVPPRSMRMRKEGFDPVGELARRMEKKGIPVRSVLVRRGRNTQKGLGRMDRLARGSLDYRLRKRCSAINGGFVILDDVCTTGATLETCASVLSEAGATEVYGMVVCRD